MIKTTIQFEAILTIIVKMITICALLVNASAATALDLNIDEELKWNK